MGASCVDWQDESRYLSKKKKTIKQKNVWHGSGLIYGFQNKIRTQQNKEEFGHLVEQRSGILERCGKHVSC